MRDPIELYAALAYHCIARGYYEIKLFVIMTWVRIKCVLIRPLTEAEQKIWDDVIRSRRR